MQTRAIPLSGSNNDPTEFAASGCLHSAIRGAMVRGKDIAIEHSTPPGHIFVQSQARRFHTDRADLLPLCADEPGAYRIRRLRADDTLRLDAAAWGGLEDLLWTVGFAASRGRLIDELAPTDVTELTEWPNLTRVPMGAQGVRLAVLFRRRPTSISIASRLSGAGRTEVQQFLSAAWCAGLIRVVNRSDAEPESGSGLEVEPDGGSSLITSLLRRLRGS